MATLNEEELAVANSLEVENIPVKLRCGTCNKLAVAAVKLPCCETVICGTCCDIIPETCPVCGHSPVSSDSCTVYKSLRNTIKAHVKIELRKRNAQKAPTVDHVPTEVPTAPVLGDEATAQQVEGVDTSFAAEPVGELPVIEAHATEVEGPGEEGTATRPHNEIPEDDAIVQDGEVADDKSDVEFITERPDDQEQHDGHITNQKPDQNGNQEQDQNTLNAMQMQDSQQGFGYDMNSQGQGDMGFTNMQNFNPMMAAGLGGMGMPGFPMGMSNMMGIPMDPSMMFNQFGGMNGMGDMSMINMGMMGGFGGMAGMNQNYGGYNQFGNAMNQQHHFPNNNRGFSRPYGRGFGRGARGFGYGRGRGGWGQNQYGYRNQSQQAQYGSHPGGQQQTQQEGYQHEDHLSTDAAARHGFQSYEHAQTTGDESQLPDAESQQTPANADYDHVRTLNTRSDHSDVNQQSQQDVGLEASRDDAAQIHDASHGIGASHEGEQDSGYIDDQTQGFNHSVGTHDTAGFDMGRGGSYSATSHQVEYKRASPPPANAPTGPKAMREGKPNSGFYSRPQVSLVGDRVSENRHLASERASGDETGQYGADMDHDEMGYEKKREGASRDRSKDEDRLREKSHSRYQDDDYESEGTYSKRKERERRRRRERDREEKYADDDDDGHDDKRARSRSASPNDDSSRRHQRRKDDRDRTRHDRSRERRKGSHRDYSINEDTTRDDGSGKHKSKSRHNDRSRDDHTDRDSRRSSKRDYYNDDEGGTTKGRKDRSSRHHGHRDRSDREREEDRESYNRRVIEQPEDEIGFKIKGSNKAAREKKQALAARSDALSDRRASNAQDSATTSLDPYAAERERFTQERAARDALRRQSGGGGGSLGKHGRGRDEDEGGSRKRRDGRGR